MAPVPVCPPRSYTPAQHLHPPHPLCPGDRDIPGGRSRCWQQGSHAGQSQGRGQVAQGVPVPRAKLTGAAGGSERAQSAYTFPCTLLEHHLNANLYLSNAFLEFFSGFQLGKGQDRPVHFLLSHVITGLGIYSAAEDKS